LVAITAHPAHLNTHNTVHVITTDYCNWAFNLLLSYENTCWSAKHTGKWPSIPYADICVYVV